MGNSPSVSGRDRGRAYVRRDIPNLPKDDQLAEMRPADHNAGDLEVELAEEMTEQYSSDESPELEPNRKAHFETIG